MYTAKILLEWARRANVDEANRSLGNLLSAWRMNGQILGKHFPIAHSNNSLEAYVNVPNFDSLSKDYNNIRVSRIISEIKEKKLLQPQITCLGEEPASATLCGCKKITKFILYTTYRSLESPLRCARCFGVVPLYKIPKTHHDEYYNIICWQSDYESCDSLQMNCAVGERFATDQISKFDSPLTKLGLKVCRSIEEVTNNKVFYYLYRGAGKSYESEVERKCPNCGGDWYLQKPIHKLFDFQCKKCLLVSNIARSLSK